MNCLMGFLLKIWPMILILIKEVTQVQSFAPNAQVFADAYSSMSKVNDDKHVTTSTADGLRNWEVDYFKLAQDSSQSTEK